MNLKTRRVVAALGVAALVIPSAATAAPGKGKEASGKAGTEAVSKSKGKSKGKAKPVTYIVKGTYLGAGVVDFAKGNGHAKRAFDKGDDLSFVLDQARLSVADTNGDGAISADDLKVGDKLVVQARLPRRDPGAGPFQARKVVDQTNPHVEEAETEQSDAGTGTETGTEPTV